MKVLVLGAGVIGVTSAYFLRRAGHEVTVLDRQPAAALETSFANGGQVSWSSGHPWAAPGLVPQALGWLLRRHSPLVLRPRLDPAMWSWILRMLPNCLPERHRANRERMLRLGRYSHECLKTLRQDLPGLHYDERTGGVLLLYRNEVELTAAAADVENLAGFGIPCRVLDRAGCVAQEPALARAQEKIVGGLHYPADELGDCRSFTEQLAAIVVRDGVQFEYGTTVQALRAEGGRISAVATDRGERTADAYVLACGSYSPLLLRPLGLRVPIYPVKGYSMTVPVGDPAAAPMGTLTDEHHKAVITRLGDRIRVAGTAELAGYDLRLRPRRCATVAHVLRDLFPDGGDLEQAEYWAGLRPMTPDNPPVLGATAWPNLYLNTGHGTLGWTLSCGSARVLADLVSKRTPEIDLEGLTLERFNLL